MIAINKGFTLFILHCFNLTHYFVLLDLCITLFLDTAYKRELRKFISMPNQLNLIKYYIFMFLFYSFYLKYIHFLFIDDPTNVG